MKILITGGAGYIGAILTEKLLNDGFSVIVVDKFLYNECSLFHLIRNPRLQVIRGDVRDAGVLKPLTADVDLIIPLAALVGAPICGRDKFDARSTNCDSVISLLSMLSNSQYVIMPTTNSAYGTTDGSAPCDENAVLQPISEYALDKVELEEMLMQREKSISLRLATVFGFSPRMRTDLLVNDFVYKAVKDGALALFEADFYRNYIHVTDVARAFIHCIHNFEMMSSNVYNVGLSDANLTKRELALKIKEHIPNLSIFVADNRSDPDKRNYIVSNRKIELTGYIPATSIDDGIKELIRGFRAMRNSSYSNI